MRMTDQRRAILAAFDAATGPLSPVEVLEVAGAEVPQLNLTTVYRNLKGMVERDELVIVRVSPRRPATSSQGSLTTITFSVRAVIGSSISPGAPAPFNA